MCWQQDVSLLGFIFVHDWGVNDCEDKMSAYSSFTEHIFMFHQAFISILVQKQLCLLEVLVLQAPGTVPSCNHSSVIAVPSCPFDVAFAFQIPAAFTHFSLCAFWLSFWRYWASVRDKALTGRACFSHLTFSLTLKCLINLLACTTSGCTVWTISHTVSHI